MLRNGAWKPVSKNPSPSQLSDSGRLPAVAIWLARLAAILIFVVGVSSTANAQCATYHTLTNGSPADATQVMDNFSHILGCPDFTGNVGINTATPVVKLDVTGSTAAGSAGTEDEFHLTRSLLYGTSYPEVAAFLLGTYNTGGCCDVNTRLDINLKAANDNNLTGDTNVMTLLSNGNVGLSTVTPAVKLDVTGSSAAGSASTEPELHLTRPVLFGTSYPQVASFQLGTYNTGGCCNAASRLDINLKAANDTTLTGDTNVMTLQSNGNVGLSTTAPQTKLDVTGSIATATIGTEDEMHITRLANYGVAYPQLASFKLGTYNPGTCCAPFTRLDINLKSTADSALVGDVNVMTLQSNGFVGIGTTTPTALLSFPDVTDTAPDGMTWFSGSNLSFSINKSAGAWTAPDYQQLNIRFVTGVVIDGGYAYGKSGTIIQPEGGKVGIATTTPGQTLDVGGTIRQSGCTTAGTLSTNTSGDIICTSDARLKNVQGDYSAGLDVLMRVTPKRFTYKTSKSDPVETFVHAGFIAQNVMTAIPEASAKQKSGYYSLDTTAIVAAAVNAIKQLKSINDIQAKEIIALRAQNANQAAAVRRLKVDSQATALAIKVRLEVLEKRIGFRTAKN